VLPSTVKKGCTVTSLNLRWVWNDTPAANAFWLLSHGIFGLWAVFMYGRLGAFTKNNIHIVKQQKERVHRPTDET
jgi:hypothetical protein